MNDNFAQIDMMHPLSPADWAAHRAQMDAQQAASVSAQNAAQQAHNVQARQELGGWAYAVGQPPLRAEQQQQDALQQAFSNAMQPVMGQWQP